jgi:hypothetical protein
LRYQVLVLGAYQVGTVHREKRLALFDELICLVDEDLPNPSGEPSLHIPFELFVWFDQSSGLDFGYEIFFSDLCDLKSD